MPSAGCTDGERRREGRLPRSRRVHTGRVGRQSSGRRRTLLGPVRPLAGGGCSIGYSETVFLEPGDPPTAHIYTPGRRIPFAGHPLVGTASLLSDEVDTIRYDTGVALISRDDGEVRVTVMSHGEMREAAAPPFGRSAWVVEMPLEYLVVECPSKEVVSGLSVDDVAGYGEIYVWAWEEENVVRSRFFAPGVGVAEDAATGSAAVALARALNGRREWWWSTRGRRWEDRRESSSPGSARR
jgi:predicted PhzF superfamily epimerase YddE/YHI9